MVNVTIVFGLLVVPYLIAYLTHFHNLILTGRMGVCLVLFLLPSATSSKQIP